MSPFQLFRSIVLVTFLVVAFGLGSAASQTFATSLGQTEASPWTSEKDTEDVLEIPTNSAEVELPISQSASQTNTANLIAIGEGGDGSDGPGGITITNTGNSYVDVSNSAEVEQVTNHREHVKMMLSI